MTACSLAHRTGIARTVGFPRTVEHCSLGIVHRTGCLTYERYIGVILHLIETYVTAFQAFQTVHALSVEHIGPFPVDAGGYVEAVKVEHEMIAGSSLRSPVHKLFHDLVVAVEEIDFESFDSHFRIMAADIFKVFFKRSESGPENYANTLVCSIFHNARHVYFGHDAEKFPAARHAPAVIHNHVLDAVFSREVYVVFVCLLVHSSLKVHSVNVPVVPPVPGHFARFYPGSVAYTAGRGQLVA